ncbi:MULTISPECIES: helix-turn-helix domain-containing protein [Methanobacterium]|uniref:LysR family transcriptional regulator n=1 Tax=Methanobacterium bryantii TaxID=2161 RepID=A0A2A2H1N1_METBR|nr:MULTISPECIES: LysR family transcriptional regulator [Methanobacterium]OEC85504.1 LysR family transcriptional regulator [Methanobacterium sp. A39]PAV03318.1 LysR family transcriptional regulator [Methanobacterium bryantii]
MKYHPKVSLIIEGHTFSYKLFEALEHVSRTYSQRKAAQELNISHAVLNRRIKEAEEKLGFKLLAATGAGSELTGNAQKILQKYKKYTNRLKNREKIIICGGYASSRLMETLSLKYGLNAAVYRTSDKNAIHLANLDMVDILTLDDPVHAFIQNLDFVPIAYDHLVLVSCARTHHDIKELNGKNFVEILDSPQRLAWNTLDDNKIQYKLAWEFKLPYDALRFIQKNPEFYTFINSSLWEGSDIIKNDTRHIISCVICNKEDKRIDDFLNFILTFKGQRLVEKCGFESVR